MIITRVPCMNVAFTRYPKKYSCPTLSAFGSLYIRYTSIRIRNRNNPYLYLYPRLSVFESESDKNVKTNTISIISIRIRSVYIPIKKTKSANSQLYPAIAAKLRVIQPTKSYNYSSFIVSLVLNFVIYKIQYFVNDVTRHEAQDVFHYMKFS